MDDWDSDDETRLVDDVDPAEEPDDGGRASVSSEGSASEDLAVRRSACHVCGLPQKCRDELARLRFRIDTGRPESLDSLALAITQMLERDGISGFVITKPKLSRHFRWHGPCDQQARYAVQVAARQGRPVGMPPGTPAEVRLAAPIALDPKLPIVDTYANLASLIRRAEATLGRLERRLDNMLDETLDVDHPTALAAHGYLLNTLRNLYATIHKLADPRRMVMLFLVKVAREMMDEVVRVAQESFGGLARDAAALGLAQADRIRVQAAVVNRGRAFASSLDELAKKYDGVLASIASGEPDQ